MKNLVFVITKSEIGGAQTWVYELTKLLSEQYNIYLITSSEGWLTDKYPNNNVSIIPSLAKMSGFTSIYHISRELRRFRADIVISSSANAGIFQDFQSYFTNTNISMFHMVGLVFIIQVNLRRFSA